MGEWDPEDEPEREHRNLFPHCPLMRGDACGNVTLEEEATEGEASDLEGENAREAAERRWLERAAQLGRVGTKERKKHNLKRSFIIFVIFNRRGERDTR